MLQKEKSLDRAIFFCQVKRLCIFANIKVLLKPMGRWDITVIDSMKKNLLLLSAMLVLTLVSAPANAQLNNLLNKAKDAVKKETKSSSTPSTSTSTSKSNNSYYELEEKRKREDEERRIAVEKYNQEQAEKEAAEKEAARIAAEEKEKKEAEERAEAQRRKANVDQNAFIFGGAQVESYETEKKPEVPDRTISMSKITVGMTDANLVRTLTEDVKKGDFFVNNPQRKLLKVVIESDKWSYQRNDYGVLIGRYIEYAIFYEVEGSVVVCGGNRNGQAYHGGSYGPQWDRSIMPYQNTYKYKVTDYK